MKGIALSIRMIVILSMAVLVLLVTAAFFTGEVGTGIDKIALQRAFSEGCTAFRQMHNCAGTTFFVSGYELPGTTQQATFGEICQLRITGRLSGLTTEVLNECKRQCGCPESAIIPGPGSMPPPPGGP